MSWSVSSSTSSDYDDDETHTINVLVESKYVGLIIGRGGESVKRLQRSTSTQIVVHGAPPTYPTDSRMTIIGTSNAIRQALTKITSIIDRHSPTSLTLKLLVPNCRCGLIIGRGGSMIRSIQNKADSTMFVACEALPGESAVIISGDSDSITESIMQVCSILIKHPVPESSPAVQNQVESQGSSSGTSGQSSSSSNTSQRSGTASSSNSERLQTIHALTLRNDRSEHSTPSTSSASRTSAMLPSAQPADSGCPVDCDEFGKYVARELKKMNASSQSQLRKEILSLITSARFQMTKKDHLSDPTSEECTICLETITDKAFATSCFHSFCYQCILQWVRQKQSCPICVGQISSIIYNVRSNDDYDVREIDWLTSVDSDSDDDSSDHIFVII